MSNSEFTGIFARICGNCGTDTRHPNGHCKLCTRGEVGAWKKANPEKQAQLDADAKSIRRAKDREYAAKKYLKNPEGQKSASMKWYENNKDAAISASKEWAKANRKRVQVGKSKYYEANKEKISAYQSGYKKKNRPKLRVHDQNYRARKTTNGGSLSIGIADKLFKLQKGKCACCGKSLGDKYHLDHIIPLALGGPNTDNNIQLLRQRCNNQKSAKHPIDFMQERGFLL